MKKCAIITGCSSGIGKATALYFAKKCWNVIATMRTPVQHEEFQNFSNIDIRRLDVLDPASIEETINYAINTYETVHTLINNAAIGVFGAFEAASQEQIQRQFDTNVFGVMRTMKGILPHFRANGEGTIINISSGVGKIPLPMQSLYGSSKFAIEGLSESVSYELASLGISVKLVLPGNVKTEFFNSLTVTDISDFPEYSTYQETVLHNLEELNKDTAASPEYVAGIIYQAATDGKNRLRYYAGRDISLFAKVRKLLPDKLFMKIVKMRLE